MFVWCRIRLCRQTALTASAPAQPGTTPRDKDRLTIAPPAPPSVSLPTAQEPVWRLNQMHHIFFLLAKTKPNYFLDALIDDTNDTAVYQIFSDNSL